MDAIADELGLDRAEVRSRNFILPSEMPYDHGLLFQDGRPLKYDSGDFPASLAKLKALVGWDDFADYRAAGRGRGPQGRPRNRLLRRGNRRRPLRGRPHPDRDERPGQRLDRPDVAGPGPRDRLRPDRRAGARRPHGGRPRHDRRHPQDGVCRGHLRVPGRGHERQRHRPRAPATSAAKALRIAADALEVSPEDLEIVDGTVRVKGAPATSMSPRHGVGAVQPAALRVRRSGTGRNAVRRHLRPRQAAGRRRRRARASRARTSTPPPRRPSPTACTRPSSRPTR